MWWLDEDEGLRDGGGVDGVWIRSKIEAKNVGMRFQMEQKEEWKKYGGLIQAIRN